MERRDFLRSAAMAGLAAGGGVGVGGGFTGQALADGSAGEARRVFRILRAGRDIGRHVLTARHGADGFEIDIDIDIVVRVLGIAAYRYEMSVRERWADGALASLDSRTNDDGDEDFARIRRAGDVLEIDGSGFQGTRPGDGVATTYYTRAFLERRPWISSQTGRPVEIAPRPLSGEPDAFEIGGDLGNVLIYDAAGEWTGCRFDAGGEPARYEVIEDTGGVAALWRASAPA
ncbi:MAG: DUF6134 family protein [Pseudomonadota bacterium]